MFRTLLCLASTAASSWPKMDNKVPNNIPMLKQLTVITLWGVRLGNLNINRNNIGVQLRSVVEHSSLLRRADALGVRERSWGRPLSWTDWTVWPWASLTKERSGSWTWSSAGTSGSPAQHHTQCTWEGHQLKESFHTKKRWNPMLRVCRGEINWYSFIDSSIPSRL